VLEAIRKLSGAPSTFTATPEAELSFSSMDITTIFHRNKNTETTQKLKTLNTVSLTH
jgi:hypothetical protein